MAVDMKRAWLIIVLAALAGCATTGKPHLKDALAQQKHAEQAYDAGNLAQARDDYLSLTRALPLNADYWYRLGNVYVRLGRPDEAADAYAHTLQREPKHAKAWHNLGIVRLRQAAAAFTEGARSAAGIDPDLQKENAGMAHGIAQLGESPAGDGSSPAAVPGTEQGP